MKKRRLLLTALVLLLPFCFPTAASAAADDRKVTGGVGTTLVTATFENCDHYVVTIPEVVEIGGMTKTGAGTVYASEVWLGENEMLEITVASKNGWALAAGSTRIAYEARVDGGAVFGSGKNVVLTVSSAKDSDEATIRFAVTGAVRNGTYTDTLTFTIEVH